MGKQIAGLYCPAITSPCQSVFPDEAMGSIGFKLPSNLNISESHDRVKTDPRPALCAHHKRENMNFMFMFGSGFP
jgi:hypothetical protein